MAGCPSSPRIHLLCPALHSLPRLEPPGPVERGFPRPIAARSRTAAFRALRPRAGWPGQQNQMGAQGCLRRSASDPRQEREQLGETPRCPLHRSWGPGGGVLSGRPSLASKGACERLPLLPASPTPSRLTPPRALSTDCLAATPCSCRLLPAPFPLAPLPRRRRQEGGRRRRG